MIDRKFVAGFFSMLAFLAIMVVAGVWWVG